MTDQSVRVPQQERSRRSLEAIYAASVELLAEGGWDAVTIGEIERRSGVTRGTFYLRFPTRDALVDYVHERVLGEVREQQDAAFGTVMAGPDLSIEEAVRLAVAGIQSVFTRVGRVMIHFARLDQPASGAEAIGDLTRDVEALLHRAIRANPAADDAIRFAIELAFAAFVARQRGLPAFPGHRARDDADFADALTLALASYLRSSISG